MQSCLDSVILIVLSTAEFADHVMVSVRDADRSFTVPKIETSRRLRYNLLMMSVFVQIWTVMVCHTKMYTLVYGMRVLFDSITVTILRSLRKPNDFDIPCNRSESRSRISKLMVFSVVIEFAILAIVEASLAASAPS